MSTMVSSLFWALFRPYHLDVLKTYSALHHHHHHHLPLTEEDAGRRSKETAASRRRWKDAARKLYNHRQRGTTTTTDSSFAFFNTFGHRLYYLLLLSYALRLLLLGWSLLPAVPAGGALKAPGRWFATTSPSSWASPTLA
ncbi:hypothetical protein TYRP_017077 [Tyrophagus putrescentiae]|nr:hypothetical protein TYRP_017077 [Tyrophagus putrescentiae]